MPDQHGFPEACSTHHRRQLNDLLFISKDAERLPEGFRRIAYDSDTMKFTFRDSNGRLYQSEAGAEYGILTPISASSTVLSRSRPNAFSSGTVVDFSPQFNSATHPLY
jgi:hypothetical protein